jgi:hypothetical protein
MRTRRIAAFASSLMLHLLVGLVALRHAPPPVRPPQPPPAPPKITFLVPPVDDEAFPGLKPLETIPENAALAKAKKASPLTLDRFTFDVAKVADHAQVLFPFLTPGLSLDHLALVQENDKHESLGNPLARTQSTKQREAGNRPLVLGENALQAMVDRSWSRRNRWKAFQSIVALADTHSADTGELPALLQRYRQQDSLQPYDDTSIRDPRLWAELELAADHVNFIGFIRRYASEHASSKATTELLFLLDDLAQSSRSILGTLKETDPPRHLARTHQESPTAYDLVVELRRFYGAELANRGLASDEAITAYYDKVRLRILMGIVGTTPGGYRANDARFLIGAIYWNQQRTEDALHWWRQLTVDLTDSHASTYAQIIAALHLVDGSPTGEPGRQEAALKAQIKGILSHDYARWLMFSVDRLWQFGYRFNTY